MSKESLRERRWGQLTHCLSWSRLERWGLRAECWIWRKQARCGIMCHLMKKLAIINCKNSKENPSPKLKVQELSLNKIMNHWNLKKARNISCCLQESKNPNTSFYKSTCPRSKKRSLTCALPEWQQSLRSSGVKWLSKTESLFNSAI